MTDAHASTPRLDGDELLRLLRRWELAAARNRAIAGRTLGLADVEMIALGHLSQAEGLPAARLATLLDLSSGGVAALVQRLERDGLVTRRPHPSDRRSSVLRVSDEALARLREQSAALTRDLDAMVDALDADQRHAVAQVLAAVASAGERIASHTADTSCAQAAPPIRAVPSLWS